MIWIAFYLAIAMMDCATDAAICFAKQRRFQVWVAVVASLFWPITAPLTILGAAFVTRKYPIWKQ